MGSNRLLLFCLVVLTQKNVALAALPQAQVSVSVATMTEVSERLVYPGRVDSKVKASVISDIDGTVARIQLGLGARVGSHQTVMRLTHSEPGFNFAPFQVTSPIRGVVSQLRVSEGSRVTKGQILATITDPTKLSVLIEATASDRAQLAVGVEGKFILDGKEYPARLEGLSPVVDPATGTSAGELSLKLTKEHCVVPGLVGAVEFSLRPRQAILVPEEAIFYKSKETFLHLVENGKIRRVPVRLGSRQKGQIQILEGISSDQTYVVRSSRHLKEGEEPQVNKVDQL